VLSPDRAGPQPIRQLLGQTAVSAAPIFATGPTAVREAPLEERSTCSSKLIEGCTVSGLRCSEPRAAAVRPPPEHLLADIFAEESVDVVTHSRADGAAASVPAAGEIFSWPRPARTLAPYNWSSVEAARCAFRLFASFHPQDQAPAVASRNLSHRRADGNQRRLGSAFS